MAVKIVCQSLLWLTMFSLLHYTNAHSVIGSETSYFLNALKELCVGKKNSVGKKLLFCKMKVVSQ